MTRNDILRLINSIEMKYLTPGDTLFEIGDASNSFYIVIFGKLELYLPNPEIGSSKILRKKIESEIEIVNKSIAIREEDMTFKSSMMNEDIDRLKKKKQALSEEAEALQ